MTIAHTARAIRVAAFQVSAVAVVALALASVTVSLATWVSPLAGFAPVVVLSDSMRPTFAAGDLLIVDTTVDRAHLRAGQVITAQQGNGTLVSHRITDVRDDGAYVTRGDANSRADADVRQPRTVRGVVAAHLTGAGRLLAWVTSWPGRVLTIGPALGLYVLTEVVTLWRRPDETGTDARLGVETRVGVLSSTRSRHD